MAEFQQIALTNTFSQWVTTTQRLVSYGNALLVDHTVPVVYSNTNIFVGNNVTVLGNVVITGTLVLDDSEYDDLLVSGNLLIGNTLVSSELNTSNLIVSSNLAITDINLSVGIVDVQTSFVADSTLDVQSNANFNQTITDYGNFETANITNLVGPANDQIYTTVNNSIAAVTVADNIAAFTAFTLALG